MASAVLAGLRTASNDAFRADDRNRGQVKNRLNDLQGAFGELIALQVAEATWPGARIEHSPMDWDGPVDDVDLCVVDSDDELCLEAKCHLDEPQKKLLLVNKRAHQRSREGAIPIISFISSLAGVGVFVGRVILLEHLDEWDIRTWPSRPELGPARAAYLTDVATTYLSWSFPYIRKRLKQAGTCVSVDEVLWPDMTQAAPLSHAWRIPVHRGGG